nr:hypothetical protein Iba_scaffold14040CG0020 [Ipomoea batatas]
MKAGKTGITRQNLHYPSHGWSVFWTKMGAYQSEIKDKLCFVQIVHIEGGIDCLNYLSLKSTPKPYVSVLRVALPVLVNSGARNNSPVDFPKSPFSYKVSLSKPPSSGGELRVFESMGAESDFPVFKDLILICKFVQEMKSSTDEQ